MAKILGPKCRLCRREGLKLYLKGERCFTSKCAIVKRNYPPGIHGVKGRNKLSGYGIQLREKQKAKRFYGLLERQFRIYFERASHRKGNTAEMFLQMLEMRADNVTYRLGFADSHAQARQLVNHGHFKRNGKTITIPSMVLQVGDIISVDLGSQKSDHFKTIAVKLEKHETPLWVSLDVKNWQGKITALPTIEETAPIFDLKQIVEFYSR